VKRSSRLTRGHAVITATVPVTLDKFMSEYIRQISESGHTPVLVSSAGESWDVLRVRHRDIQMIELPMAREVTPKRDLVALLTWIRLLIQVRPQLILAITPKAAMLSMVAGFLTRAPRRLYLSGGLRLEGEVGLKRWILWLAERVACAAATEVVVNSPSLRRVYLELRLVAPEKLRQTSPGSSHGIDTHYFDRRPALAEDRAALGLDRDIPVVTFVGRLTRDKGVDTVMAASELLSARGVRHQLLVVGGQDEPDSARYVEALGRCRAPVLMTGALDDIRPCLAATDVHVLASHREGFPNVVLEAAAMAVPSVVTDATGCVDSVIHGHTGLVVPVGDARALSAAIEDLLNDPNTRSRMGRRGREWVSSAFVPHAVVAEVLHGTRREAIIS
jgi:glycosyltransferase involved in cell wall biosynthesis